MHELPHVFLFISRGKVVLLYKESQSIYNNNITFFPKQVGVG